MADEPQDSRKDKKEVKAEELAQKRAELKSTLMAEFNRVAPQPKIVKVNDVIKAFDDLAGENLSFFERVYAKYKIGQLRDDLHGQGVYEETDEKGKKVTYVDSTFLQHRVVDGIDKGEVPAGREESARKAGFTAIQALDKVADQSVKVTTGVVKPKP